MYYKIEPFDLVRKSSILRDIAKVRLPLALSSGGLNLAQSSTHHGTDSFERVRQFDFFIIRGPRLGWFDGCIGVKIEFPSAQVESRPRRKISRGARAAV